MDNKIVIIGGGHAGGMTAIHLRKNSFSGPILIISDEIYLPYQRPALSKDFLSDETSEEQLYLKNLDYFKRNNINILLNTKVKKIDRHTKLITTNDAKKIAYEKLVIATGSNLIKMNTNNSKIYYLRTINDSKKIKKCLSIYNSVAIIGAGYIGLEVACAASKKSLEVNVFEMGGRVMERSCSKAISDFFLSLHKKHHVTFNFNTAVKNITHTDNSLIIHTNKKEPLAADCLVAGIGVRPNTKLALEAGLACDNGITVDAFGYTSDKNIFATGDCTNHPNSIFVKNLRLESVQNAVEQSKTIADMICGNNNPYKQVPWFWSDQYDARLQIAGIKDDFDRQVILGSTEQSSFSVISLKENRVLCIESVNRPSDFIAGKKLIAAQTIIPRDILKDSNEELKKIAKTI